MLDADGCTWGQAEVMLKEITAFREGEAIGESKKKGGSGSEEQVERRFQVKKIRAGEGVERTSRSLMEHMDGRWMRVAQRNPL